MNVWIVWYREVPRTVQEEEDSVLTLCGIYSTKEGAERGKTECITCDADICSYRSPDNYFVQERVLLI